MAKKHTSGRGGANLASWLMGGMGGLGEDPSLNPEFTTAQQGAFTANAGGEFNDMSGDVQSMMANGDLVQDASGQWTPNKTIMPAKGWGRGNSRANFNYSVQQAQGGDAFNQRQALLRQQFEQQGILHTKEAQDALIAQQHAHDLQAQGSIYGTPTTAQIEDINRTADNERAAAQAIDRYKKANADYETGTTALLDTPAGRMANAIAIQRKAVLGSTAIPSNATAVPPSQLGGPGYITPADRTEERQVHETYTSPDGKVTTLPTFKNVHVNVPGVTRPFVDPSTLRNDLQQFRGTSSVEPVGPPALSMSQQPTPFATTAQVAPQAPSGMPIDTSSWAMNRTPAASFDPAVAPMRPRMSVTPDTTALLAPGAGAFALQGTPAANRGYSNPVQPQAGFGAQDQESALQMLMRYLNGTFSKLSH